LESSAMGGRKLGEIRFIEMRPKWPYRITTKWILWQATPEVKFLSGR